MVQTIAAWEQVGWGKVLFVLALAVGAGLCFFSALRALSRGYCSDYSDGGPPEVYREDSPGSFYIAVFIRLFFGSLFLFLTYAYTKLLLSELGERWTDDGMLICWL